MTETPDIARRFTPEQLRRWASQWAAGPVKVPEPPTGDDGLTLAEAFNLLADQIEALHAKLDRFEQTSVVIWAENWRTGVQGD